MTVVTGQWAASPFVAGSLPLAGPLAPIGDGRQPVTPFGDGERWLTRASHKLLDLATASRRVERTPSASADYIVTEVWTNCDVRCDKFFFKR